MLVMQKSLTDLMIMFHLLVNLALFRGGLCVGNAKFPHRPYDCVSFASKLSTFQGGIMCW